MEIEVKEVKAKKVKAKKNKGKKLKIENTDSQLKKVAVESKAIQKQGKKKKLMNGNLKPVEVTETKKKNTKSGGMNGNVKDTAVVKKKKKGENKGNEKESIEIEHQEEPNNKGGKRKKLKAHKNKNLGDKKTTAEKKNKENKGDANNGQNTVKAGKRKRDPEDDEKQEFRCPKKKRVIEKYNRTLLIRFPDSLVVKKESQAKAIAGDSAVEIRFPNVPRGQSKGCCYAVFSSVEEAKEMKKTLEEKEVEGEPLHVEYLGDTPLLEKKKQPKPVDPLKLYVGRLPKSIKRDTLAGLFPTASEIKNCKGFPKTPFGHAFIMFKTEEEAKKVFENSKGLKVEDSEVLISYAYLSKELREKKE